MFMVRMGNVCVIGSGSVIVSKARYSGSLWEFEYLKMVMAVYCLWYVYGIFG